MTQQSDREKKLEELYYTCECWGACFSCGNPDCGGCFGCCGVGLNEDEEPYAEFEVCPCKGEEASESDNDSVNR